MQLQRRVHPRPGINAQAIRSAAFPLPEGLQPGALVEVTNCDEPIVEVRDASGRSWELFHWQIDCGREYSQNGWNWLPESHPQVISYLEGLAIEIEARVWPPAVSAAMAEVAKGARAALTRQALMSS